MWVCCSHQSAWLGVEIEWIGVGQCKSTLVAHVEMCRHCLGWRVLTCVGASLCRRHVLKLVSMGRCGLVSLRVLFGHCGQLLKSYGQACVLKSQISIVRCRRLLCRREQLCLWRE
ncbi:hypothetical protein HPP92_004155 [Vanilla planifolia]|uniref:Uncharacterized protein n=1 Tax=Vanilla planifolia TaxID=51239 RepID=A0A835VP68_VANPL|nr:hypothetical protein HPP92_004155 [Vanilla planifolia]